MVKISANPFHPRSRETETWGDAHRKKTVGIYRMDGKYGIELGKSN